MRVAFYDKHYTHLLGVFRLTPDGIVVDPPPGQTETPYRLNRILTDNRPPEARTDAEYLAMLPHIWRSQCHVLADGQSPPPGFDDQPAEETPPNDDHIITDEHVAELDRMLGEIS